MPQGNFKGILQLMIYKEAVAKWHCTFWECPPPMGFTHPKAPGKVI
jgi:hypothetical protein